MLGRVRNRLFLLKVPVYGPQFAIFHRIIEPSQVETKINWGDMGEFLSPLVDLLH